ncbi:MAG: hypothetical protein HQL37_13080 [Alphaproteobacteria bacterium]|nr:hypothetical protein [Alphaproteobacteria bacterium]
MMPKLAVWATAVMAWQIIIADIGRLLRLLWPWLLAHVGALVLSAAAPVAIFTLGLPPWLGALAVFVGSLASIAVTAPIGTTMIRWVIAGPQLSAPLGRREGWYLLTQIILGLLSLVPIILPAVIGLAAHLSASAVGGLTVLSAILIAPLFVRLILALVPAALGSARLDLAGAWRHGRGNGLRIILCLILTWLPLAVALLGLGVLALLVKGPSSWTETMLTLPMLALRTLLMMPWMVVGPTVAACIYRNLSATPKPTDPVTSPAGRRGMWFWALFGLGCAMAAGIVVMTRTRTTENIPPVMVAFRMVDMGDTDDSSPAIAPPTGHTAPVIDPGTGRTVRLLKDDIITNAMIKSANVVTRFDHPAVEITLEKHAAQKFYDFTKEHVGRRLAILVDEEMVEAVTIREPISGGICLINGNFTQERAERIAAGITRAWGD